MKNSKVWVVIVCVIVLLLILGGVYFMMNQNKGNTPNDNNVVRNNGNVENNTPQVGKESAKVTMDENVKDEVVKVDEFELTNISLTYQDEMSDFSAEIKNNSNVDYAEGIEMKISFYRADDSLMYELPVMTSTLLSGGTSAVTARTTLDLTDAKTITVSAIY